MVKNKKEYVIVISIDGEDYYVYGDPHYNVRLTKKEKSATKIKKYSLLEAKIKKIINNRYAIHFGREILASSDDYICITIAQYEKELEQLKSDYNITKSKLAESIQFDVVSILDPPNIENYNSILNSMNSMKTILQNAFKIYPKMKKLVEIKNNLNSKGYKFKKIEFKIIDASHNFRYSKLKKLIEENDK